MTPIDYDELVRTIRHMDFADAQAECHKLINHHFSNFIEGAMELNKMDIANGRKIERALMHKIQNKLEDDAQEEQEQFEEDIQSFALGRARKNIPIDLGIIPDGILKTVSQEDKDQMADFEEYMAKQQLSERKECTCGAKHTSNPSWHMPGVCDLAE